MFAAALALVSCGGGGGGAGGGGPPPLTMTLSTQSLNFTTASAVAPPPQTVTANFTGQGAGTLYVLITPADPTLVTVGNITVAGTSGSGSVTAEAPGTAGPGSHTTTITVKACLNDPTCATNQVVGSPQTINVTYTVSGLAVSVPSLSYVIGNAPTAADTAQTFSVSGYPAQTWNATNSTPWVNLTPASGSTSAAVSEQATLDLTKIATQLNATYSSSFTYTPQSGPQLLLPVNVTIARTQVNFVSPYVGISNRPDSVIIRGENFSMVSPSAIRFGNQSATSFSVVSDTEIDASYPALSAGAYPVQVLVAGSPVGYSRARLVVVDPPGFPAARIAYATANPSGNAGLVYDAERQALLTLSSYAAAPQLQRTAYAAGAWGAPVAVQAQPPSVFALGADGAQLFLAQFDVPSNNLVLASLDPSTLQPAGFGGAPFVGSGLGATGIAVANTGDAIISTQPLSGSGGTYEFRFKPLVPALQGFAAPSANGVVGASADGATVLLVDNNVQAAVAGLVRYDTRLEQLAGGATIGVTSAISIDRHGAKVLVNDGSIYDGSTLTKLGSLAATPVGIAIAPDATRAYAYDANGTVRVYDLTQAPVAGIYPEVLPAKTLSGSPSSSGWATLAVSPDGGSMFVAIDSGIYVVPLP